MSVAWVFNLDAEDELKRGSSRYAPKDTVKALVRDLKAPLSRLLGPGDEVVWPPGAGTFQTDHGPPAFAEGDERRWGRCWCPTPWAVRELERARLKVPRAPDVEVLRAVNHRRFCHDLGDTLPGAAFVTEASLLIDLIGDSALLESVSSERNWLMKLPLGYAGRGRRKIAAGLLNATDLKWVHDALRHGDGVQLEPLVAREIDCALHGWLSESGELRLGKPTVNTIDASGRWVATERATGLAEAEVQALERAATESAERLHASGFFGPFGIDAFRWRDPSGGVHFRARCEINARYSMGWAVGMGDFRAPDGAW